ncbi:hypothetical protein [Parasphaerochaeta coccoides]|nr:hypothetical protein [Parasphaerochaeta coccoides]
MENERYSRIRLFTVFLDALGKVAGEDGGILALTWGRAAFGHRLASYLHQGLSSSLSSSPLAENTLPDSQLLKLPGNLYFDVAVPVAMSLSRKTFTADVLLHDRGGNGSQDTDKKVMSVVIRDRYLTEDEQLALHELQENDGCSLALAISLFSPQKPYLLIYRVDSGRIDYYHYQMEDGTCSLFKQREIRKNDDSGQLSLGMPVRRKRKKS